MKSHAISAALFFFYLLPPSIHSSVCEREASNLGNCLYNANPDQEEMARCLECHEVPLNDTEVLETCPEFKSSPFCSRFNDCIERNCPEQCLNDAHIGIRCVFLELDCDMTCSGGSGGGGGGFLQAAGWWAIILAAGVIGWA